MSPGTVDRERRLPAAREVAARVLGTRLPIDVVAVPEGPRPPSIGSDVARRPSIYGASPRSAPPLSPRFTSTSPSIPGYSLARAGVGQATRAVLIAAGRDLARINAAPVAGFGWVRRDRPAVTALAAGHPALPGFVREHLDSDLALLGA